MLVSDRHYISARIALNSSKVLLFYVRYRSLIPGLAHPAQVSAGDWVRRVQLQHKSLCLAKTQSTLVNRLWDFLGLRPKNARFRVRVHALPPYSRKDGGPTA